MDNLTHGLVGAAISKAGADRATPLATATLVIAANAPDVDVLSYIGGQYFALACRRGITHGWPALIVLPFLVSAGVLAWDRWVRRRRRPGAPPARPGAVLVLSAIGVLTHPALDWLNTYGMRWGLPFDPSWSYGDTLFIIDPWIWLLLGGALFLKSRRGRSSRTPVVVALSAVTLYIGAMMGSNRLAGREVAVAARAAGLKVYDLMVAPRPANPFSAAVEVVTNNGYVPGDFHWMRSPRVRLSPDDVVPLLQTPPGMDAETANAVVEAARADRDAAHYHTWSRFPYARIDPDRDGWTVTFADARYDSGSGAGSLSGLKVSIRPEDIR